MSYVGKGGAIIDDGFVCLPIRRISEIPLAAVLGIYFLVQLWPFVSSSMPFQIEKFNEFCSLINKAINFELEALK